MTKTFHKCGHNANEYDHLELVFVLVSIVCDCGHDKANSEMLRNAAIAYQRELNNLVSSGRYDTRNDFTVVLQPFFKNTEPPTLVCMLSLIIATCLWNHCTFHILSTKPCTFQSHTYNLQRVDIAHWLSCVLHPA